MEFLIAFGTDDGENPNNDHSSVGMEPVSQSGRHRLAKPMRWTARVIALAGATFFLTTQPRGITSTRSHHKTTILFDRQ